MATPEGRVKAEIKKRLKRRGPKLKAFWPVQRGMGEATIDTHVCYYGQYLVIEAKAPGEKPTPRQECTLSVYDEAEAETLVIDGTDYAPLEATLDRIERIGKAVASLG